MQKIYVLLRNDRQTGPYSLEEIIQFDLKPYDLIWIEGKSAGWYYPQEIAALHPYLNFLPPKPKPAAPQTTTARNVFVTMPSVAKTEEPQMVSLPEIPAYPPAEMFAQPAPGSKNLEEEVQAFFTQPVKETAPAATATAKQKKSSTISVGGGIAAVLIVGCVFAASWIMNRHSNEEAVVSDLPATAPASEVSTTAAAKNDNSASQPSQTLRRQKQQKSSTTARQTKATANQQASRAGNKNIVMNSPAGGATDYGTAAPAEEKVPVVKEETSKSPAETQAPQEKKKTLREKFLDLFKKKPEAQKEEETKPDANSERTATHREADANLAQLVHVRFDVPNNWMMGIKGAKATLVNRSNQTISKATVEVLYYDDDDQLLQKKVVTFGKIDSKESQTITIPDHATATKVDYNIVSVVGKPAA